MSINLDHLKQIAEAATLGPWHQGAHHIGAGDDPHDPGIRIGNASFRQDARHIAAFDPPTALALIQRIRELETKLDEVRALVDPENESGLISADAIFHTIGTANQGETP